jgi:YVTN family beta-propeller protein
LAGAAFIARIHVEKQRVASYLIRAARGTPAYATIGGENAVKIYTTGDKPDQVATIPVDALPHGAWASDDDSRMYVGLENGDAVEAIDTASNKVVIRVPVGEAPQALVYISNAVPNGSGLTNLVPCGNSEPINIALNAVAGDAKGFVVARNLGVVDAIKVSLFKLKPQTVYSVYVSGQKMPVASFTTNSMGAANGAMIGPLREVSNTLAVKTASPSRIVVMEGEAPANLQKAVQVSAS